MTTRRSFLTATAASLAAATFPAISRAQKTGPKRLAIVTTLWNYRSHAWHMAERFLHGYPREGKWHRPPLEVVSAYVDQQPSGDLSKQRSDEFGFKIYPSVAEALRCGGAKIAVDAVLQIGEHGNYPINAIGQKQYPRYELFSQIAKVFKEDGRATPVFNDKHLSWNFSWAQEMVETAKSMNFPLLADEEAKIAEIFGVEHKKGKETFEFDDDGDGKKTPFTRGATIKRWTYLIGKDGKIASVYKVEDAQGDSKTILKLAKELK